jgi:hypothetical protein
VSGGPGQAGDRTVRSVGSWPPVVASARTGTTRRGRLPFVRPVLVGRLPTGLAQRRPLPELPRREPFAPKPVLGVDDPGSARSPRGCRLAVRRVSGPVRRARSPSGMRPSSGHVRDAREAALGLRRTVVLRGCWPARRAARRCPRRPAGQRRYCATSGTVAPTPPRRRIVVLIWSRPSCSLANTIRQSSEVTKIRPSPRPSAVLRPYRPSPGRQNADQR